ncbi:DUF5990 family protein [Streptomyces sp. NPDC006655]|uniref:DUF5990 family protein n=1 Tax=Streptomyces sp. NPDC006655 TaxID=3156898 RepID=UPI0034572C3A
MFQRAPGRRTTAAGPDTIGTFSRPGIHISWGTVDEVGAFTMLRSAELFLDAVPTDVLDAAVRTDRPHGRDVSA